MKLPFLGESCVRALAREQNFRAGHYHTAVTIRENKFIKIKIRLNEKENKKKKEKVRDRYNEVINITI